MYYNKIVYFYGDESRKENELKVIIIASAINKNFIAELTLFSVLLTV